MIRDGREWRKKYCKDCSCGGAGGMAEKKNKFWDSFPSTTYQLLIFCVLSLVILNKSLPSTQRNEPVNSTELPRCPLCVVTGVHFHSRSSTPDVCSNEGCCSCLLDSILCQWLWQHFSNKVGIATEECLQNRVSHSFLFVTGRPYLCAGMDTMTSEGKDCCASNCTRLNHYWPSLLSSV